MDIKIIQWRVIELQVDSVIEKNVAATSFLCMCGCCHMIHVVKCIGLYKQLLHDRKTHNLDNFNWRQGTGIWQMGHLISERAGQLSFLVLQYEEYGKDKQITKKGVVIG